MTGSGVPAVLATVVLCAGIALLSAIPYSPPTADSALVRLAWRLAVPADEVCRPLTAEERASLPAHMQRDSICEARSVPFRLVVSVDGAVRADEIVSGAGVRGDRPMVVLRDLPVEPGRHEIEVRFGPERTSLPEAPPGPDREVMRLQAALHLDLAEVVVVTHDETAGRLVLLEGNDDSGT